MIPKAARILHLLTSSSLCPVHLHQIQAQLILHNLHSNTTVAHRFITACNSLNLLTSAAFPLYVTGTTKHHTFTYNTLLKAFSHSKTPKDSLLIYSHMQRNSIAVNNYTFPFLLKSLADLGLLKEGEMVHCQIARWGHLGDIYVGNALLDLYASCGDMSLCSKLFDEMPLRDVVSWTVTIKGYTKAGKHVDALVVFERMRSEQVAPNRVTMVNALAACAGIGGLDLGVWIHEYIEMNAWELDVILGTSLIDMYGKCGRIELGLLVFEQMVEKNVFTWNVVIKGLAMAKSGKEAVRWFLRMEREGFTPDEVTLIAVLCGCVHSGLVRIGQQVFSSLIKGRYGFSPSVKHYACMIDLLARSGLLEEALRVTRGMGFKPSESVWGALLAGGRAHGGFELSELAAWKLAEMDPGNSGYYVVLGNLYAEIGRWDDVEKVRELMRQRGFHKDFGSSMIEVEHHDNDLECLA